MYRVPNWGTYQGYKKRGPPWVKLHVALLRKLEWLKLPLSGKALLPALWIIASESGVDGSLPDDHEVLAHLSGITEPSLSEGLKALISFGFIDSDKSVASSATNPSGEERRGETKGEARDETVAVKTPIYFEPPMPIPPGTRGDEEVDALNAVWAEKRGGLHRYIAECLPVVRAVGLEKTKAALIIYLDGKEPEKFKGSPADFAANYRMYMPKKPEKVVYMTKERLLASQR